MLQRFRSHVTKENAHKALKPGVYTHACTVCMCTCKSYLQGKHAGEEIATVDVRKQLGALFYIFPLLCFEAMTLIFLQLSCLHIDPSRFT